MASVQKIEDTLDAVFAGESRRRSGHARAEDSGWTIYPEEMLHISENANKYYVSLQGLTRQFLDEPSNTKNPGSIVQFGQSQMSALSRQKVRFWDDKGGEKDNENGILLKPDPADLLPDRLSGSVGISGASAASSLFAWSSGDSYIAARKRELQRKNVLKGVRDNSRPSSRGSVVSEGAADQGADQSQSADQMAGQSTDQTADQLPSADQTTDHPETTDHPPTQPPNQLPKLSNNTPVKPNDTPAKQPKPDFGLRLTTVVEKESNRFIQDRIELIKSHHMKQAARKIDERRKRDHELHLRRVELKEEKYEKILKAAIALQTTQQNSGFFGSLFGPKPVSNSFTLEIADADVSVKSTIDDSPSLSPSLSPSPVPITTPEARTSNPGPRTGSPVLTPVIQSPKTPLSHGTSSFPQENSPSHGNFPVQHGQSPYNTNATHVDPGRSSRSSSHSSSSVEFEEFQSSSVEFEEFQSTSVEFEEFQSSSAGFDEFQSSSAGFDEYQSSTDRTAFTNPVNVQGLEPQGAQKAVLGDFADVIDHPAEVRFDLDKNPTGSGLEIPEEIRPSEPHIPLQPADSEDTTSDLLSL